MLRHLILAVMLMGCAGTQTKAESTKADEPVCRREKITGSHLMREVCRTDASRAAEREAAQGNLRKFRPQPNPQEGL